MSVYDYIARSNPKLAESIINSFGYEVVDRKDLGKSLKELVANVGEPALAKIMENHPDRDVIMEINKPKIAKVEEPKIEQPSQNCGCWKCKNHSSNYLNANGAAEASTKEQTTSNTLAHQTNIILVVSALFIATALIMSKR
jgi:hypothetical protein